MVLDISFFKNDVLEIAPALVGKKIVRIWPDGSKSEFIITETEAYKGENDLACHARKGKTERTSVMYLEGGVIYVYLIYGMYWMLNIVTGPQEFPQALLIRALEGYDGPGKTGKILGIDKSFNGVLLCPENNLYIENNSEIIRYKTLPRVGIDYADEPWKSIPWRFVLDKDSK